MSGTCIRIKGLKQYRHPQTNILYTYHRATGRRIMAKPGTPAFLVEIGQCQQVQADAERSAARPARNTLGQFVNAYKESDDWKDLAPRTRLDYDKVLDFLQPLADQPMAKFTAPELARLRDKWRKARGRRFVNYVLTVLSILLGRAVERGAISENTAKQVRRVKKDKARAPQNRPWAPQEREAVWQAMADSRYAHLRLPLALGMYLGMREGDMIALPRSAIKSGQLELETAKRKVWIDLPLLPNLLDAINAAHKGDAITLCVNSRGRPWTLDGFRTSFFKVIKALENQGLVDKGLTYHGLRHTVASMLAEQGVNHEDIAAVLGQKSSKVAAHYADRADRKRRAGAVITRLDPLNAVSRRTD